MEGIANEQVANGKTPISHGVSQRFDNGSTLTYERTNVPTDDYQDTGENPRVLNPSGGVEKLDSLLVMYASEEAIRDAGTWSTAKLPVLNHEPRPDPANNRHLWAALMRRDGGRCWMCGDRTGLLVADHLRPRSSYQARHIESADSSANLRIACWDCNQRKSNTLMEFRPTLPIVWSCVLDHAVELDESGEDPFGYLDDFSTDRINAFCSRHNCAVRVPSDWPIAGLL